MVNNLIGKLQDSFGNIYDAEEYREGEIIEIAQDGAEGMIYDVSYRKVFFGDLDAWEFVDSKDEYQRTFGVKR